MPKFLSDIYIEAPTFTITNGDGGGEYQPIVTIESINSTAGNEPLLRFYKNSTGSNGEDMGTVEFLGKDNGGTDQVYGKIVCQATNSGIEGYDGTIAGSERGQMSLAVASNTYTYNVIKGTAASTAGVINVSIGQNAASVTTVAGDLDIDGDNMTTAGAMTLTTGGAYEIATSSGNITLDSAGDIALEAAGNDVTVDADNFVISSGASLAPKLEILSTSNSALPGVLLFNKQRADDSPADDNMLGVVSFVGEDANGAENYYGAIGCSAVEVDAGNEAGRITITVSNDGVSKNGITMTADPDTAEEVDVVIANGALSRTTTGGDLYVTSKLKADSRIYSLPSDTVGDFKGGDIYYYGDGATVKGGIYYIDGTNWTLADADGESSASGLLAVALGTDPDVDGMLLRGFVTLLTEIEGTEAIGSPIFLSATDSGKATITAPAGNADIVRVLGYSLHATENQVYFNPDNTFVEVTA